jgi:hypothetical protein
MGQFTLDHLSTTVPHHAPKAQLQLNPFAKSCSFQVYDSGADFQTRHIELHQDHIVIKRYVKGMRMAFRMPLCAFKGVMMNTQVLDRQALACVTLVHQDEALSVPLYIAEDSDDILAQWRIWSKKLHVPLLTQDQDGEALEVLRALAL